MDEWGTKMNMITDDANIPEIILALKYFDACEKMLWEWTNAVSPDVYFKTIKLLGAIDAERGK